MGQQRPGNGHTLALTPREARGAPIEQGQQIQGGDNLVETRRPSPRACPGKSVVQIAMHRPVGEQARVLEYITDAAPVRRQAATGGAVQEDLVIQGDPPPYAGLQAGQRPQ